MTDAQRAALLAAAQAGVGLRQAMEAEGMNVEKELILIQRNDRQLAGMGQPTFEAAYLAAKAGAS